MDLAGVSKTKGRESTVLQENYNRPQSHPAPLCSALPIAIMNQRNVPRSSLGYALVHSTCSINTRLTCVPQPSTISSHFASRQRSLSYSRERAGEGRRGSKGTEEEEIEERPGAGGRVCHCLSAFDDAVSPI